MKMLILKSPNKKIKNIQDNMKRTSLKIVGIEESYHKDPKNIFHKIIDEKFPNLKKNIPIKVQKTYITPNRFDKKKLPMPHNNQNTNHIE